MFKMIYNCFKSKKKQEVVELTHYSPTLNKTIVGFNEVMAFANTPFFNWDIKLRGNEQNKNT